MHLSSFGINNSLIFIKMVIHDNFPIQNFGERKKRYCTTQYCRLILLNAENVHVVTFYLYYLWLLGKDNYKNSMFFCLYITITAPCFNCFFHSVLKAPKTQKQCSYILRILDYFICIIFVYEKPIFLLHLILRCVIIKHNSCMRITSLWLCWVLPCIFFHSCSRAFVQGNSSWGNGNCY